MGCDDAVGRVELGDQMSVVALLSSRRREQRGQCGGQCGEGGAENHESRSVGAGVVVCSRAGGGLARASGRTGLLPSACSRGAWILNRELDNGLECRIQVVLVLGVHQSRRDSIPSGQEGNEALAPAWSPLQLTSPFTVRAAIGRGHCPGTEQERELRQGRLVFPSKTYPSSDIAPRSAWAGRACSPRYPPGAVPHREGPWRAN